MVFGPVDKGRLADAVPDATGTPLTVTVARALLVVGVMVIDFVPLLTVAV